MAASSEDCINLMIGNVPQFTQTSEPDDSCGYLENLPDEILDVISNFLPDTRDKVVLSQTCSHLYSFFQQELNKKALQKLLKAVIDDDRATVKKLLEINPRLLLEVPPKEMVIESQYTCQTFYAEKALIMAARRKQIKMMKILLFYFDKLPDTEEVNHAWDEGLSAWAPYEIRLTDAGNHEVVIPREYELLARFLIDAFSEETFPHGTGKHSRFSDRTEAVLTSIRKLLKPAKPIKLENAIDPELFLLALYSAYDANHHQFQNSRQRNAYCVWSMGLTQHILPPEMAKVICEGLYYVVKKKKAISERAASLKLYGGADFYHGAAESQPDKLWWRDYLCVCGWDSFKGCWCESRAYHWLDCYQNYCQTKETEFGQIMYPVQHLPLPPDERSLCAIS